MPRGAGPKREQEYEELRDKFKKEGRYKGREEEVAARIVNKQRREYSETKEERQEDRSGKSPDRNLPIQGYDRLTISQIAGRLGSLSKSEIRKIKDYEAGNKNRKGLVEKLNRVLESK